VSRSFARGWTLLQAQRWTGTLTAAFAFAACAVSGELGPVMIGLFPLAVLGAAFLAERVPRRLDLAWTVLLVAVLVVFVGQVVAGQLDIVLAAARFAELLCIHRLWHRRSERDEMILLLLSLLMLCAGAALTAELSFAFAFFGFAISGTWAVALTHLRFAIEAGRGPAGSAALLRSRRVATPALLGALGGLAMLGLAGAVLVFFLFPRVTIGGLRRASRPSPVAGLGDRVDLSRHGVVADDPRVALRVRLDPPPAGEPRNLAMHWRARSLSRWTGHGWSAQEGGFIQVTRLPRRPGRELRSDLLSTDIEMVGTFADGVVLIPEGWPLSVDFRRPGTSRLPAERLYRNAAGDLFYQPVDGNDLTYRVVVDRSAPDAASLRGRGRDYPAWLKADLEVPLGLDPRIAALAERLGGGKDPADAAVAIEIWLSTALRYTRELPGEVEDPVADFLFGRRAGHCELFSSAMVLMMRSLGIPARNVTGYFGGRRTDAGYYAVRAGDAHSWVEVYFPEAGFVRFDPTPPSGRGSVQESAWARLLLAWDALQQRWRAAIVEYDLVAQAQAMRRVGQFLSETGRRLAGKSGSAGRLRAVAEGVLLLSMAAALVVALRRIRKRERNGRTAQLSGDQRRALRLWRAARARLRGAGVVPQPGATPRELLRAVPAAREVIEVYSRVRWGGGALSSAEVRALLRQLDSRLDDRVAPGAAP